MTPKLSKKKIEDAKKKIEDAKKKILRMKSETEE